MDTTHFITYLPPQKIEDQAKAPIPKGASNKRRHDEVKQQYNLCLGFRSIGLRCNTRSVDEMGWYWWYYIVSAGCQTYIIAEPPKQA